MTPKDIELVQADWLALRSDGLALIAHVYDALFQRDPSLRLLFQEQLYGHHALMLGTFDVAIRSLTKAKLLSEDLADLGAAHWQYGLSAFDYMTVEAAILDALAAALGEHWYEARERSWRRVLGWMLTQMQNQSVQAPSESSAFT